MVVEGKDNLAHFLSLLKNYIDSSVFNNIYDGSFILENSTSYALELLVMKPVVCYVKKGSLLSNNSYVDFESYVDQIVAIEDIFSLLILQNLELYLQKKFEINWIAFEAPVAIGKSTFIATMCSIDVLLARDESNTVGRLNYKKIEDLFSVVLGEKHISKLTRDKRCKSFLSCVLKIFPTYKKNDYVTSVEYDGNNYNISKEELEKVYRTKCYVCNNLFSVVLHGNKKHNVEHKYIFPDDIMNTFSHDEDVYVEMVCQECIHDKKITRPTMNVLSKLKSEDEYNNIFLKLYNSVIIDEVAVLSQSHNIILKTKRDEDNNAK